MPDQQIQNRPHPNQAPKPDPDPTLAEELQRKEVNRIANAIALSKEQEKQALDYNNQHLTAKDYTFSSIFALLVAQVIEGHITPHRSKQYFRNWYASMTEEQRDEFRADRNKIDDTVRYFQGVVDTLAQEVPYMLSN